MAMRIVSLPRDFSEFRFVTKTFSLFVERETEGSDRAQQFISRKEKKTLKKNMNIPAQKLT